ncbi:MAG: hypothetical protein EZS28_027777 [Streblomastix strix]|uniref:Uncharacterized protein n=1 Tax=Streblomastix strix TaxID=222440 RepID=A0A5J4V162_9EUKA|nr:MAG: hypothetical protein EZS28_027777 [Streblomastix strix]
MIMDEVGINQRYVSEEKIVTTFQLQYSNDSDDNRIQKDEDHNSNDNVFGEVDLIQLQVRGHRGKGKKGRVRGKPQSQALPLLSSHRLIQEGTYCNLKVPEQRRGKPGAANWTINPSAQSFRIKQITGWSDFNFGSSMDIDMEQMIERDLIQTLPTTNDGPIVSTVSPQLGTASWRAGGKIVSAFAAQHANTDNMNYGNEMNIPQQGHLAAQGADFLGFQPLIGQEQEQSEDEPEQDQGQLDLNNLPDNSQNEGPPGLYNKPDGAKRIMATLIYAPKIIYMDCTTDYQFCRANWNHNLYANSQSTLRHNSAVIIIHIISTACDYIYKSSQSLCLVTISSI